MKQTLLTLFSVLVVALAITRALTPGAVAQTSSTVQEEASSQLPLYEDLGDFHYTISSANPLAQQYFDQGMRLYYAFNHAEAIRAFKESQKLDESCAICWWGEALAWGPNINLAMDTPSGLSAFAAIEKAQQLQTNANQKEQMLIAALAARYEENAPEDRAHLDQAYAGAMAELTERFPEDLDIAVLYAESLMDLRPWDYWNEAGETQPGIDIALKHLLNVLGKYENHPGACHFYIHAVEEVYPQRAVACAERLANLMPGAGHLVHMPGHIYIRVGRYLDAVTANQHAVHADETYIQDQHPGMGMYTVGYYPHNYDFLAFAAMMIGQSETAIDSAHKVTSLLPVEMFGSAGMDFLQHWLARPLQMQVRFAKWNEILHSDQPAQEYPHAVAMWHYARGRAFLGNKDVGSARQELAMLQAISVDPALAGLKMEFNQSADLLAIASSVLAGWIAASEEDFTSAVSKLEHAVVLEDQLLYGEPPEWSVPVRQELGAILLQARQFDQAEQVFAEDLAKFPENGWSLHGMIAALTAQGRNGEAQQKQEILDRVWSTADFSFDTE